jgi:two-component system nitrate/nitrite response regulator NarL
MASPSSPRMLAEPELTASRRPIRVLIALGSPMECQLLLIASKRSRQQMSVVGCAVSKTDILQCFSRGNIDVSLINADLEDGRLAGLDVLPEIHASYPGTPIVTLFDTWNDDLILHAFRSGAKGVFCRTEKKLDMLWKCIAAVRQGQVWANSGQMHLLLNTLRTAPPTRAASSSGMNLLATRETHVANLVAEGLPNKEIARRLGITQHTVSNYLFNIYNKLGISSRVELVLYMMKQREEPTTTG